MSQDFKEYTHKESLDDTNGEGKPSVRRTRHSNPSLFGPIVLISIGVLFLLNNLGLLPNLTFNWVAAFQLWPLLLILVGINIVVRQAPRPLGGLLSAFVGLIAVGIFGYVLLFSEGGAPFTGFIPPTKAENVQHQEISYPIDDAQSARIEMNLGLTGTDVYALEDSPNVIEGQVSYVGDLRFDTSRDGSQVSVFLREDNDGMWWLNPANWGENGLEKWQIGLTPRLPLDLRVNVGPGSADLDLSDLTLQDLNVDGGPGSMEMSLPDGDYDAAVNVGAGSATMQLAANGRQKIEVDGGAGSLTIQLPADREARITVDGGLGSFSINGRQFTHVSGADDEGVWETAGYQNAPDALDLLIDVSVGSVSVNTR